MNLKCVNLRVWNFKFYLLSLILLINILLKHEKEKNDFLRKESFFDF